MHLVIRLFIVLGLGFLAACSPGSGGESSPQEPLDHKAGYGEIAQGKINGQDWVFRSGRAYQVRRHSGKYLVIQLWSQDYANPCKEKRGSDLQVRLAAPYEHGSWQIDVADPFNSRASIFFSDLMFKPHPRDNMRADRGDLAFILIDRGQVSGAFAGSYRNSNVAGTSVLGDFTVPICQDRVSFRDNF